MAIEDDDLALSEMYRMPAVFGPAPGPRNVPKNKRHLRFDANILHLSVTARSEASALKRLLPKKLRLAEATFSVGVLQLRNLGWLAGRGYNIVSVTIPVIFEGRDGEMNANFLAVMWENMADPILTGREELGYPKLFAEIASPRLFDGSYTASAGWQGFRFLDLSIGGLHEDKSAPPAPMPMIMYKYMPRTGEWGKPDAAYFTSNIRPTRRDVGPKVEVKKKLAGTGSFQFHAARWEDMPTQYPIVSALAALPVVEFLGATIAERSGQDDIYGQHVIE